MQSKRVYPAVAVLTFLLAGIPVLCAGCKPDEDEQPAQFSITVDGPFENGTVSVKDGLSKAKEGDIITLIAVPDSKFDLDSLTVEGTKTGTDIPVSGEDNERTFTMPGEPVTVTAAVFLQFYSIDIGGPFENGTVTVQGNRTKAAQGDTITLVAAPENDEWYYLDFLTVEGEKTGTDIPVSGEDSERTFTMPGEPVTVTAAVFLRYFFDVTMAAQYFFGCVTGLDGDRYIGGSYKKGQTVTLLILPDDGYYLDTAIIKGNTTGDLVSDLVIDNENNILTFTMPAEDVTIWDYNNGLIFKEIE